MRHQYSDSHATSYRDGSGDWRDDAACRGEDPELFFPVISTGPKAAHRRAMAAEPAKAHCRRCPVISECLEFAIDTGQVGVWGCMDDDERRELRKQLGMAGKRVGL